MQNENFINGFLKQAGIPLTGAASAARQITKKVKPQGMSLISGSDFVKKINSKLKSPMQTPAQAGSRVTSGVRASSYNSGMPAVKTPINQSGAEGIKKHTMSNYAQSALKSTGSMQGLKSHEVG